MTRRGRREVMARWLREARRALGVFAVLLLAAVALAALLLPPAAEADGPPPVRPAGEQDQAAPATLRDGLIARSALDRLAAGLWIGAEPAQDRSRQLAPPRPCGAPGFRGKVNLNLASEQELDLLPGIGPAKAQRIVAWRTRHGPFRRIKDLRRVKGFGRKSVLKLFPFLTLDGPTTASVEPAR
jgi:competence ComEA-like helix-hairpin-helix protein